MRNVSLITDLGNVDHYVALLKAKILNHTNELRFLDVSHDIAAHDIQEAAYFLRSCFNAFPSGSIHLVSVFNYYVENPEFVIFEYQDHYFIGPNNGILSLVFSELDESKVYKIDSNFSSEYDPFECFAQGIAKVNQQIPFGECFEPIHYLERKLDIQPVVSSKEIRATIIYIDHFENVVLNVTRNFFEENRKNRNFKLYFKHNNPITQIEQNYGSVPVGDVFAFFNSADYLEIAINMGKASSMLDLYKNETVQIYFEDDDS